MLVNSRKISSLCLATQNLRVSSLNRPSGLVLSRYIRPVCGVHQVRGKKDDTTNLSTLFKPVQINPNPDDINVGAELTGKLDKGEVLKVLNKFTQRKEIKMLCQENGLDGKDTRSMCNDLIYVSLFQCHTKVYF